MRQNKLAEILKRDVIFARNIASRTRKNAAIKTKLVYEISTFLFTNEEACR